jgi:hypothetical protein
VENSVTSGSCRDQKMFANLPYKFGEGHAGSCVVTNRQDRFAYVSKPFGHNGHVLF